MSRAAFLTTNEISTTNDLRYHHGLIATNRINDTLPIVVQSSTTTTKSTNKAIERNNPKVKRNLRGKRRATGIRPDEVSLATTSTEGSGNEDDKGEENPITHSIESNEILDHNRTILSSTPAKSVFTVNRIQTSFENLSIPQTDPYIMTSTSKIYRPEGCTVHRKENTKSDDDSSTVIYQQLEERIRVLESVIHDRDNTIHDLQHKLNNITRDLTDAEQQIHMLHQEKLTLIKAFTTLQDNKPSKMF